MNRLFKELQKKDGLKLLPYKVINRFLPVITNSLKSFNKRTLYKKSLLEFNTKTGDIFISTYMKSGTTWLQMILYQLTSSGEMNFEHIYDVSPWIDRCFEKGEPVKQLPSPRFFKTHIDYNLFPKKFDAKIICVVRDGMDVAVSQFHQLNDYGVTSSFEDSFKKYFINKNRCKDWFHYTKHWLNNKNNFNILYVRFEDLKTDFTGTLYKIADFCNIDIKEEELPRIIKKCSFQYMKKYEAKFVPERDRKLNFIRKGKSGTGKEMFNKELIEIYKDEFNKHLAQFEILNEYCSDLPD